ncbi:hypothetical protein [Streptomyces roseolilacinus]|uniref:hypothetical protein n=1 Tax=Streptomyces roseolilacinus TaxID=66904 RepID=UPI00382FA720
MGRAGQGDPRVERRVDGDEGVGLTGDPSTDTGFLQWWWRTRRGADVLGRTPAPGRTTTSIVLSSPVPREPLPP